MLFSFFPWDERGQDYGLVLSPFPSVMISQPIPLVAELIFHTPVDSYGIHWSFRKTSAKNMQASVELSISWLIWTLAQPNVADAKSWEEKQKMFISCKGFLVFQMSDPYTCSFKSFCSLKITFVIIFHFLYLGKVKY